MACILEGTYTFVEGFISVDLNYDESLNYLNLVLTLDNIQYECRNIDSYDDGDGVVTLVTFADSYDEETAESSYPRFELQFHPTETNLGYFVSEEGDNTRYDGEATLSICEKESEGSCPDVPFSESAPEKYADYFNEDGVFVPKASNS